MQAESTGHHEDRTRVICHLPLNNTAQDIAVKHVIRYVEAQRSKRVGIEGYTYSEPGAFHGRWWSSRSKTWLVDNVVLLIVDFNIALTDKKFSLSEQISKLKTSIARAYREVNMPQEEIWLIAHPVTRHA